MSATGLCPRHAAAAVARFGNTPALSRLTIRLFELLWEDEVYQAIHAEVFGDAPPVADRDARTTRRLKAQLSEALEPLGAMCCHLGPERWELALQRTAAGVKTR